MAKKKQEEPDYLTGPLAAEYPAFIVLKRPTAGGEEAHILATKETFPTLQKANEYANTIADFDPVVVPVEMECFIVRKYADNPKQMRPLTPPRLTPTPAPAPKAPEPKKKEKLF